MTTKTALSLAASCLLTVRKNMQSILATKLKNATFELRKMEKEHCAKVQELHGDKPSTQVEPTLDESQMLEEEDMQVV